MLKVCFNEVTYLLTYYLVVLAPRLIAGWFEKNRDQFVTTG